MTRSRLERRRRAYRPGDRVRFQRLGTIAWYEMCDHQPDYSTVRVILAPGLPPGWLVRLTPGAFRLVER